MAFTKLQSMDGEYVNLIKPGESVEGIVKGVNEEIPTKYGTVDYLNLKSVNPAEPDKFMVISSNLAFVNWTELIGQLIRIELKEFGHNPKTNRTYKKYEVMVDRDYEDVPF